MTPIVTTNENTEQQQPKVATDHHNKPSIVAHNTQSHPHTNDTAPNATNAKLPQTHRPSITKQTEQVDESFRNHHPPMNGKDPSIGNIDVSHISKADESLQGNNILDASAIPPNSIKKPKQNENKEKVRYRYATSSSSDEEGAPLSKGSKQSIDNNKKPTMTGKKSNSDESHDEATKNNKGAHWNQAKHAGGWKTATRSMESIPSAASSDKSKQVHIESDIEEIKDNISTASSSTHHSQHKESKITRKKKTLIVC